MEYEDSIKTNWLFDNDKETFDEFMLRGRLDHCSAYPIKWRKYYFALKELEAEYQKLIEQNIDDEKWLKGAIFGLNKAYNVFHEFSREYCESVVEDERKRFEARKDVRQKAGLNSSDTI